MKHLTKQFNPTNILILILVITFLLRVFRLWYPQGYVFDEVYHAFTAKEYLKSNPAAWEWWTTPPPGVAYEWTHPPFAKELMAASMGLLGTTASWAWRLPGVIVGTLAVWMVYLIGKKLFNTNAALIAAFLFSIDGLNFVQSRTGMNDIYFVFFFLASFVFFLDRKLFLSAFFLGLSLASKWTALYFWGFYFLILLWNEIQPLIYHQENLVTRLKNLNYFYFLLYLLLPPIIYLITYIPFFLLGHTTSQFIELQKQMWWYHTHLKATHDYASAWWSWPLNLYPVWYFVDYNYQNGWIANIFASGNPVLFITGVIALLFSIWEVIKKRTLSVAIVLLGYLVFWLPWAISPRIMFLYHYSPSVPFMTLAIGHQLDLLSKDKANYLLILMVILLSVLSFAFLFPILTGIAIPKEWLWLFFFTNLTKNPFGPLV